MCVLPKLLEQTHNLVQLLLLPADVLGRACQSQSLCLVPALPDQPLGVLRRRVLVDGRANRLELRLLLFKQQLLIEFPLEFLNLDRACRNVLLRLGNELVVVKRVLVLSLHLKRSPVQ